MGGGSPEHSFSCNLISLHSKLSKSQNRRFIPKIRYQICTVIALHVSMTYTHFQNLYQLLCHLQLALMRRSKNVKICECGPFQRIGMGEMVHLLLHSCLQTYSNNEKVRQLCAKSNDCFSRSAPLMMQLQT